MINNSLWNSSKFVRHCWVLFTWNRREQGKPETHTKRQATQNGCLPSLLVDGDKGIEIVYI
jgi:hypothetical protein